MASLRDASRSLKQSVRCGSKVQLPPMTTPDGAALGMEMPKRASRLQLRITFGPSSMQARQAECSYPAIIGCVVMRDILFAEQSVPLRCMFAKVQCNVSRRGSSTREIDVVRLLSLTRAARRECIKLTTLATSGSERTISSIHLQDNSNIQHNSPKVIRFIHQQ